MKQTYFMGIVIYGILNLFFLFCNYETTHKWVSCPHHAQLAYTLLHFGKLNVMQGNCVYEHNALKFSPANSETPTFEPFTTRDTIGYGFLLALLWKITGNYNFIWVQLLQILLTTYMLFVFYRTAKLIFQSELTAFLSTALLFAFFPIAYLTVQPVRDIWAYYGSLTILYIIVAAWRKQLSNSSLYTGAIFAAACLWMRPTIFLVYIALGGVGLFLSFSDRSRNLLKSITVLWSSAAFLFLLPFCWFNKVTYNRYFVSPAGYDMLASLGDGPNPWGLAVDDNVLDKYLTARYPYVCGQPEYDEASAKEFYKLYQENPRIYWQNLIGRIPELLLPALPWIYCEESPYKCAASAKEKLLLIFNKKEIFFDFLLRVVYPRLLLILGYIGAFILFLRRRYDLLALIVIGVIAGGWAKFPSHIERRYLIPSYWAFALLGGYALQIIYFWVIRWVAWLKLLHTTRRKESLS